MKKYTFLSFVSLALFVFIIPDVFAQSAAQTATQGISTLSSLVTTLNTTLVRALGTLLMSLAVVIFFVGIVQYLWGIREGDAKRAKDGSVFMTWGLVALFVMFSVYGIIRFGQNIFFGTQDVSSITIPSVNLGTGSTNTSGTQGTQITNPLGTTPTTGTTNTNTGTQITNPLGNATAGADCTSSAECGGTMVCRNFQCQAASTNTNTGSQNTGSATAGADCTSNAECGGTMTCQNFQCR